MYTMCIQCAMRALLADEPPPSFEETPKEHMRRCHPDLVATLKERVELEQQLAEKLRSKDGK